MTQTPPEMTRSADLARPGFDVVSQVLGLVRLGGAIFLRAGFRAPWAYFSPPARELAAVFLPGATNLVLFHIIAEGRCSIVLEDGARHELTGGDVVVLPYGDAHTIGYPQIAEPVVLPSLVPSPPWREVPAINYGGDGEYTLVICGYLQGDDVLFDPLLRALPSLFVVRPPPGPAATWLAASVEYALLASRSLDDAARMNQRLPELLFTEVLRLYLERQDAVLTGWLAALRDPVVGSALQQLHADPARDWSVTELATAVAASRTVLVERFHQLVGCPPIRYLTEWRLKLASGLLRTTDLGVAQVANRVGYGSEEGFSRAFKRKVGQAPAVWRADIARASLFQ